MQTSLKTVPLATVPGSAFASARIWADHRTTVPTRGLMDNSGTNRERKVPDDLWAVLSGHRWHATSLDGLRGIVDSGAIEIRPGYNGLCKSLRAVSLFDFGPTSVDIKSGGHWTEWCGFQQAASDRVIGVPQKRVGVWLRVRDDYTDDRLIDAAALREIWMENKLNIIPGVEGGHHGPLAVAELDQIVVIGALCLSAYRVWDAMPSAGVLEEVSDHIDNLPVEPLSPFELAHVRARQKRERLRSGDASSSPTAWCRWNRSCKTSATISTGSSTALSRPSPPATKSLAQGFSPG